MRSQATTIGHRRRVSGRTAMLCVAATLVGALVVARGPIETASAAATGMTATLPTENPSNWTPNVLNGAVDSIWQVGNRVFIGGRFTQVANANSNGGAVYARSYLAAFDATTGLVDESFNPALSAPVEVVIPSADGTSIYIGGDFNTVNGVNRRKVAQLNITDGSLVTSFNASGVDGLVRDLRLVEGNLYMAGLFTSVAGQPRSFLASLNPITGALTDKLRPAISGLHNGGIGKVIKIDVTPDGRRLLATGNFTTIDGLPRRQVALFDLTATPATLSPWNTTFFNSTCSSSFDSFMRDLDISADGKFAVFTTTGAYRANTSCDTVSRFELGTEQDGLTPTWINMTGGDTSYAAEIHDGVVYVGGHMRWFNNPFAADRHGAGGVYRNGMGALDATTGLPFSWNPGRTRGVGLFDYFVTDQGVWAGSDTDRFNDELRARLAFFPFAGGTSVPFNEIGDLPNSVVQLGRTTGTTGTVDQSVLYRVNAGGPTLTSVDDGPNWAADTATTSPLRTSGSSVATAPSSLATPINDAAVPKGDLDRPPAQLWTTERNDPAGGNEMLWAFPVPAGTAVQVRLYLANRNNATDDLGERVFDVQLDGATVLDDLDLSGTVGHNFGTTRSFDVVSDGTVDIRFVNGVNNPLVNGIEIINRDVIPVGTLGTQDDVVTRQFDGTSTTDTTTTTGTVPWRTVRGAFMVNSTLFTIHLDGSIMKRTVNDGAFGPGKAIDMWANNILADAPSITGMVYDPVTSRVYYTMSGQSSLFYRSFLPESGVLHAQRSVATGDITALSPSRVRGMFLGNGRLWFGDSTTGNLLSMSFENGRPVGTPTLANTEIDWRSRAMFRSSNAQPNVDPTAGFTFSCSVNSCDFDGTSSTDSDGTIVSYEWDFGDGATALGATAQHSFAAAGTYQVVLRVTDDRSGAAEFSADVTVDDPPNVSPVAVAAGSCTLLSCTFDGAGSYDPDGTIASYEWAFGDGVVGSGTTPVHEFAAGGLYTATLTVTDVDGASATAEVTIEAIAPSAAVLLRASASANSQSTAASVVIPTQVASGDQLIYIVTANASTTITTPAGWTLIGTRQDGTPDMTSWIFTRTADGASAGSTVTATLGVSSKSARTLLAYQNAVAPTTALSSVITGTSAALTTPAAPITYGGSAVVSYWSDKSSSNISWTVPAPVQQQALSVGSGSGRITASIGDAILPAGQWPGATAISSVAGTKGIGWTVVLTPATGNLVPVASFSTSCASLQCSFDAASSFDPDGSIISYEWAFGDGTTASGPLAARSYVADGSYTVTLTVTDDDGATTVATANVNVTLAVVGFRSANSSNQNSATASVAIPADVQSGDQLILLVAVNGATSIATPAGWSLLGSVQAGAPDMVSNLFTRTADLTSAGSVVTVPLGTVVKSASNVLAYTGAAPVTVAASSVSTTLSSSHATPPIAVATNGSRVLSYWVDKTSANTGWVLPEPLIGRSTSIGTGSGRVTSAAGDVALTAGTWPGATATSTASGAKQIGWSVVIPAP